MLDDKTREQIALFRYGLIADLLHRGPRERGLQPLLLEKAEKVYEIPGSRRSRVAAETIRDWLMEYRRGGFDALRPRARRDQGQRPGDPAGDRRPALPDQGGDPGALGGRGDRAGASASRDRRGAAPRSGDGPPAALTPRPHGQEAQGAHEQGSAPLRLREGGRAVDERRDARTGGLDRGRPQAQELPHRPARRRHPRRPLRRLRSLREHRRLPPRPAAGDPPPRGAQAALRGQRRRLPLEPPRPRLRQARRHPHPRAALPATGQRKAGTLVSDGTTAAPADAHRRRHPKPRCPQSPPVGLDRGRVPHKPPSRPRRTRRPSTAG